MIIIDEGCNNSEATNESVACSVVLHARSIQPQYNNADGFAKTNRLNVPSIALLSVERL